MGWSPFPIAGLKIGTAEIISAFSSDGYTSVPVNATQIMSKTDLSGTTIANTLKTYLKANPFINTVSIGDIFAVDLTKQTMFPLSHIIVNNATLAEVTTSLNISILFMDIVDDSKSEITDIWEGNDNEQDVLNTRLAVAQRLTADLMRGSLYTSQVVISGEPSAEPFTDRFENKIAGWTLTFDVIVPNDITIC